jgi:hypothetical protein
MMNDANNDQQAGVTGTLGQAPHAAQAVTDQAADGATSAKNVASGIAGQATAQTSSLVGQVKDKAFAAASDQKEGLADRLDDLAHAVHKSGEQFAGQQDWIASAIERGAAELGALATSLRQNDIASLFGQAKSIAQRQPALFIGASLATGFAVARLSKIVAADVSRDDLPTMPEVGHGGH